MRRISGVRNMHSTTKVVTRKQSSVNVAEINSCVVFLSSGVSLSLRYVLKVGINATEMEFSAKSLLKRFGTKNAIENASDWLEVPKKWAFVISRIKPKTLEPSVNTESESPFKAIELSCFFVLVSLFFII